MADSDKAATIESARLILGIPRPNADALVALNCAWEMGLRKPESLAHVAEKMLRGPATDDGGRGK
jgi:hypothetical protein